MGRVGLAALTLVAALATPLMAAERPPALQRGCTERVEGGVLKPRAPRDTVVGPIGWMRMPSKFEPSQAGKETGGYPSPPVKALAVVRAPRPVTVTVPERQRAWMDLIYKRDPSGAALASEAVRFHPCPRSDSVEQQRADCEWEPFRACSGGYTQFNGGIFVDYERAPKQGRCARVVVRVPGERTRRPLLFGPSRRC